MQVLRTVEQARRERALLLLGSGLVAMFFAALGFAWWLGRPGRPVDEGLGVALPPGSREVFHERVEVDPAAPFEAVYVSAAWPVEDVVARFDALAVDRNAEAKRFVMPDGTIVHVSRPEDVPATRLMPIHPIAPDPALGTRSWIVIMRGTPPAGTWSAAVPPGVGES